MVDLVTHKNEEDPIINKGARVVTTLFIDFFRRIRAANSIFGDGILIKFKLIQTFMVVLVTCKKMKKIHSKIKALERLQHFSHYRSMGIFQTLKGS